MLSETVAKGLIERELGLKEPGLNKFNKNSYHMSLGRFCISVTNQESNGLVLLEIASDGGAYIQSVYDSTAKVLLEERWSR